jgi:hypothetical protein
MAVAREATRDDFDAALDRIACGAAERGSKRKFFFAVYGWRSVAASPA